MIHTRQQLIEWIEENVTDRTLQCAMNRGDLEVLGGFNPLPTSANPGWIIQIKTVCATYLVAVAHDQSNLGRFYWFNAPHVPWQNWTGHKWIGDKGHELEKGDRPGLYFELLSNQEVE